MRFMLVDSYLGLTHIYSYFYWNLRGVRIDYSCRIHLNATIMPTASFFGRTYVYDRSQVGYYTYGTDCVIDNAHIGNFCSIAPGTKIGLNEHPLHLLSTHPLTYDAESYNADLQPTKIGHDVWIGANAVIRAGIAIEDGCVVAAGAVVVKDCPAFSIIGGVPARIIGQRPNAREFVEAIGATNSPTELEKIAQFYRRKQHLFTHTRDNDKDEFYAG